MNKDKQLIINMIASLVALIVNLGINFFLSPYIINSIGKEAYGFISLANNFVNYATIITIALNSVAGRFITISIHRNNENEANEYFNSVLIANLIIGVVLIIPSIISIINLQYIIDIPYNIIYDVKLLFLLIFLNFIITIIGTTFAVATFATNNLYLDSLRKIESNILKVIVIIGMFCFFKPNVSYIGISTLTYSIYLLIFNIGYTKKLLPQIKVNRNKFSLKKIIEMISSGIWNTITRLGQILSDGLDLLIGNIFISATAMGDLAIAKSISSVIGMLIGTVSAIFTPQLTIYYAKNDIDMLVQELKRSMKITSFFSNIPLCFLIAFSTMFYELWIPGENIEMIAKLTFLSIQAVIVSGPITSMYNIYTITNKLKADAILRLILGVINVLVVFILLKTTNLGTLAIAGVSTTTGMLANFIFVPIYAAKCLKVNWKTFYPIILRYIIITIIMAIIFIGYSKMFTVYSWILLIFAGISSACMGASINYLLLFNKEERKYFIEMVKYRIFKRGNQ